MAVSDEYDKINTPIMVGPKTGTQFLVSSHFTLGLEPQWMARKDNLAYCSVFKKDYPPHPLQAQEQISLPKPAKIMHQNGDGKNQYCSITKEHFIPKPHSKEDYLNSTYALTKTNFKMDADKKVESFRTTHTECYTPQTIQARQKGTGETNWMPSHIPQGDKGKVQWPESDYHGNFKKKALQKIEVPLNQLFANSNAIKGDEKVNDGNLFVTTNQEAYPHKSTGRNYVEYSTKYPSTNIPQGDKEKLKDTLSTQQVSFPAINLSEYDKLDRLRALKKLQSTSFKIGDTRNESFCTTAHCSYQKPVGLERELSKGLNISGSSFPEGDQDPLRSLQRISSTVNRSDFAPPPPGYGNPKVDGSKIRTLSHVDLGIDDRQKSYETTMTQSFQRNNFYYRRIPGDCTKSSIPMHQFSDMVHEPSYKIDFGPNRGFSRMRPNPTALKELKRSHIRLPDSLEREFDTTHRITYTPKQLSKYRVLDSGRIQRSSVPLGTLSA